MQALRRSRSENCEFDKNKEKVKSTKKGNFAKN